MQIEIHNLRKVYPGGVVALQGLDLKISTGIFGLLGPNGSGKTTLMRILATLQDATSGEAVVGGHDVHRGRGEVRRLLGYMPEEFGFYPNLTAYETLDYFALLCQMNGSGERRQRVEECLRRVNLADRASQRVSALSHGMKQRLGVAQALLNDPKVLILDEPTAGLDPEERIRLRNLLAELSGDRIVILSTHIVSDVAATAEQLCLLYRGRRLFAGRIEELLAPLKGRTWIIDIEEEELSRVQDRFFVTGVFRSATGMQVRVLAEEMTDSRGYVAEPTLDDAYVAAMKEAIQPDAPS